MKPFKMTGELPLENLICSIHRNLHQQSCDMEDNHYSSSSKHPINPLAQGNWQTSVETERHTDRTMETLEAVLRR